MILWGSSPEPTHPGRVLLIWLCLLLHPSMKLSVDELKKKIFQTCTSISNFCPHWMVWFIAFSFWFSLWFLHCYEKFDQEKECSVYTETLIWWKKWFWSTAIHKSFHTLNILLKSSLSTRRKWQLSSRKTIVAALKKSSQIIISHNILTQNSWLSSCFGWSPFFIHMLSVIFLYLGASLSNASFPKSSPSCRVHTAPCKYTNCIVQ